MVLKKTIADESIAAIKEISKDYPRALSMFLFLIDNMDYNNKALVVSRESLSEELGYSNATVGRMIAYLIDKKYLDVYKSGTTNVYCIDKKIVWQDSNNNKKHTKFTANVYVSASEQVKLLKGDAKMSRNTELFKHYQTSLADQMDAVSDDEKKD